MKHCLTIALLVSAIGAVTCQNSDDICVEDLITREENYYAFYYVCPDTSPFFNVSSLMTCATEV